MNVYANITLHGENTRKKHKVKTSVDRSGGSNPIWNQLVKYTVNERLARDGSLTLVVRLISRQVLGNKDIGTVNIPVFELLNSITPTIDSDGYNQEMKLMTYQVRTRSGIRSGSLTFSYRFKPDWPVIIKPISEDATAYPPPSQIEHPPELPIEFPKLPQPPYLQKHPFAVGSSNDPLPISYDAVMTKEVGQANKHEIYAQPLPSNQGYRPYGYAPPSPVVYEYGGPSYQRPKEIGLGTGLGAGLLGGLITGDIVYDVANCYDL